MKLNKAIFILAVLTAARDSNANAIIFEKDGQSDGATRVEIVQDSTLKDALVTRTFKLEPNRLPPLGNAGTESRAVQMRRLLNEAGIEFNSTSAEKPWTPEMAGEKAFYYNDRTDVLMVRATRREMALIDRALARYYLAPLLSDIKGQIVPLQFGYPPPRGFNFDSEGDPSGPKISITVQAMEANQSDLEPLRMAAPANYFLFWQNPGIRTNAPRLQLLTELEFGRVLEKIKNQANVDLLPASNRVTLSGRPVRVPLP